MEKNRNEELGIFDLAVQVAQQRLLRRYVDLRINQVCVVVTVFFGVLFAAQYILSPCYAS